MAFRRNAQGKRRLLSAGVSGVYNAIYAWHIDDGRVLIVLTSVAKASAENVLPELVKKLLAQGSPAG
jgi:hypothetical protein